MLTDKELRNAAYRRGDCTDCGAKPHSAGRTRCDGCHTTYARGSGLPTQENT